MNRKERAPYLQALFDHIQDAIFFLDDEARIVDANPAACALLGYRAVELENRDVWEVLRVRSLLRPEVLWEAFLREGKQTGETQLQSRDGTLTFVEVNAVAHIAPGIHMAILRDITERVQRDQTRQRREAFLAHLLEQLPALIWYADSELRIVSMVGRGVEEWQLEREALVGRPFEEVLQEVGNENNVILLEQALAGQGGVQDVPYRERSLRLFVTPFRNPEGEIEGVIGLALDQSEQKRMEQELFQKHQELALLIEHATDIISRMNLEGRHLYVNPVITKFTGLLPEKFIGKTNAELGMPDELLVQWREAAQAVIESRKSR